MSISRQYGEVVVTCDDCDTYYESGEQDLKTAIGMARENGWYTMPNPNRQRRSDPLFSNYCSGCAPNYEADNDD